jgi:hypothetical protein
MSRAGRWTFQHTYWCESCNRDVTGEGLAFHLRRAHPNAPQRPAFAPDALSRGQGWYLRTSRAVAGNVALRQAILGRVMENW